MPTTFTEKIATMHEHIEHINGVSINALLAAIMVALAAGVLGCFVVWRKLSYFGDSISHGALLGMVIGLAAGISQNIGIIIICIIYAAILTYLQQKKLFANDTILGILAHSALALGLVTLHLIDHHSEMHEHDLLFGTLADITSTDLIWVFLGSAGVIATIWVLWNKLVLVSISEELAQGEGIKVPHIQIIFTALMTITVAISVKLIGIVLITSLMIIPAATARQLSRSPKQMAIISAVAGVISVNSGILFSMATDAPVGPSVVVCAAVLFVATIVLSQFKGK